jgi:carboxylesterase
MHHIFRNATAIVALAALTSACNAVDFEDDWMDSTSTESPAVADPEGYLVSARGEPSDEEKDTPVLILAHDWSGAPSGFSEFADYAADRGALVSNVLLGGHGRSLDAWLETDADDWAAPIREEHARLSELGYRDINFALVGVSNALFVRLLEQGELEGLTAPKRVALLSPTIISSNKALYTSAVLGPVLNNVPAARSEEEKRMFYTNRPHEVLIELADALVEAEHALDRGDVALPEGTVARIWVAEGDKSIDFTGVDKLETGLVADEAIERTTVDSEVHTFWRGLGRPRTDEGDLYVWTDADQTLAEASWASFYDFLTGEDA